MFKVTNKDTRTTSLELRTYITPFSTVSTVDFEQIHICWVNVIEIQSYWQIFSWVLIFIRKNKGNLQLKIHRYFVNISECVNLLSRTNQSVKFTQRYKQVYDKIRETCTFPWRFHLFQHSNHLDLNVLVYISTFYRKIFVSCILEIALQY